jgi:hypothetical protein
MKRANVSVLDVVKILKTIPVGNIMSYADFTKKTGLNPQSQEGYYVLHQAYSLMLSDHKQMYAAVRGRGIKHLTKAEMFTKAQNIVGQVKAKAEKMTDVLDAVEITDLPTSYHQRYRAAVAISKMLTQCAADETTAEINKMIANGNPIPGFYEIVRTIHNYSVKKENDRRNNRLDATH